MIRVQPVILCGGSGTRLWPLSRAGFPKQFLVLSGVHSLFQLAFRRLNALSSPQIQIERSLIVTNEEHRFLAMEQIREIDAAQATFILEPIARNTAAALTLAALEALGQGLDPVLIVSPSDQHIGDEQGYAEGMRTAIEHASHGAISLFGVTPERAEPGYGYIRFLPGEQGSSVHKVRCFVEKPSAELAQQYLDAGDYAWNSGMFVLKASVWLNALRSFRPDILKACDSSWALRTFDSINGGMRFIRPNADLFAQAPAESVDYAVIEQCPGSEFPISMVDLQAQWSDVGAWDAVWRVGESDSHGNVTHGDVLIDSSQDNFIHATSRLVSVVGVRDLAIVETADAVLICHKSGSQRVKNIVAQLQSLGRSETKGHRKVHRPWGWYDSVDEGDRFKVKRICVKPGASLSLQQHLHRAEHWVVIKGQAQVTCGDRVELLRENQSTYIPAGAYHRLTNFGDIDAEIIEVQTGEQLSESDVIRVDEVCGKF